MEDVERVATLWGLVETDKRMSHVNTELHFNSSVFLHGRPHSWKETFIHRVILFIVEPPVGQGLCLLFRITVSAAPCQMLAHGGCSMNVC